MARSKPASRCVPFAIHPRKWGQASGPPAPVVTNSSRNLGCLRHEPATLRAYSTHLSTPPHHLVIGHALTGFRAPHTDFSTDCARLTMKIRTTQHKISTRCADLCAVLQQSDVLRGRVFASLRETMGNRFNTDRVTLGTVVDALIHVSGLPGGGRSHRYSPLDRF